MAQIEFLPKSKQSAARHPLVCAFPTFPLSSSLPQQYTHPATPNPLPSYLRRPKSAAPHPCASHCGSHTALHPHSSARHGQLVPPTSGALRPSSAGLIPSRVPSDGFISNGTQKGCAHSTRGRKGGAPLNTRRTQPHAIAHRPMSAGAEVQCRGLVV